MRKLQIRFEIATAVGILRRTWKDTDDPSGEALAMILTSLLEHDIPLGTDIGALVSTSAGAFRSTVTNFDKTLHTTVELHTADWGRFCRDDISQSQMGRQIADRAALLLKTALADNDVTASAASRWTSTKQVNDTRMSVLHIPTGGPVIPDGVALEDIREPALALRMREGKIARWHEDVTANEGPGTLYLVADRPEEYAGRYPVMTFLGAVGERRALRSLVAV